MVNIPSDPEGKMEVLYATKLTNPQKILIENNLFLKIPSCISGELIFFSSIINEIKHIAAIANPNKIIGDVNPRFIPSLRDINSGIIVKMNNNAPMISNF